MSTIITINQLGVAYNDVGEQNMLYRKTDTRHPFVFIDFGSADPAKTEIKAYDCFWWVLSPSSLRTVTDMCLFTKWALCTSQDRR